MGFACQNRNFHIRNLAAGQNAEMRFFLKMGHYETLPVSVQTVLTAKAVKYQSASLRQRLHEKLNLRIVTQRLIMSDSYYRSCNRFFIYYAALPELNFFVKSFLNTRLENFLFKLSHYLDMNFL